MNLQMSKTTKLKSLSLKFVNLTRVESCAPLVDYLLTNDKLVHFSFVTGRTCRWA